MLALASCLVARPRISYIDFKVLASLFSLMVVIKAFENLNLLDKFAVYILNKCADSRRVSLVLILLSFFMSMLVTNDIALITLVPLALVISKKSRINMLTTIILQTLAANIGSSLTPMGNPQNLFIFSYYKLTAIQFFTSIFLFVILGLLWLYLLNCRNHNVSMDVYLDAVELKSKSETIIWPGLFSFIILSVFNIISYQIALILTLTVALCLNRKLLYEIDYLLLITFVCFFVFIGNVSTIPGIYNYMKTALKSSVSTYFSSILLSQLISNVPCSIFLSRFTPHWRELLLGVNIGGMGTLIASLASVISYKFYVREHPQYSRRYLCKFTVYNMISLLLFTLINYLIVI